MFQFLFTTVKPFTNEFLTKNVLELIFKRAVFKESRRTDPKLPREYLYKYNKGCNYFILILSGEATIEVGKEKLEFPAGPFAYFGVDALLCGYETADQVLQELQDDPSLECLTGSTNNDNSVEAARKSKQYLPDFSLRVDEKCVYMKIDRNLWRNGVIKSRLDRLNNQISDSIDFLPSETVETNGNMNGSKNDLNTINKLQPFLLKPITPTTKNKRSSSLATSIPSKTNEITLDTLQSTAINNDSTSNQRNIAQYFKHTLNQLKETENSIEDMNSTSETEPLTKRAHVPFKFNVDDGVQSFSIDMENYNENEPFIAKSIRLRRLM